MTPPLAPDSPAPFEPQFDGDMPDDVGTTDVVEKSGMRREVGKIEESRRAHVKKLCAQVKKGKEHWEKDFKRMREDLKFLGGDQWGDGRNTDQYVANITQRHVQQRVAALYAKNPTVVCKRRKLMDFRLWDESAASLMSIQTALQQQAIQQGQMQAQAQQDPNFAAQAQAGLIQPPQMDPNIQALLQDVIQGTQKKKLMDRAAATLEIVFRHELATQHPPFKTQMKQLVRRALGASVGYVKLGYQRAMKKRPEDVDRITDVTQRIALIEQILADVQDGECEEHRAEHERLKQALAALRAQPEIVVSEGLVFDFPKSTAIIPDPRCTQLHGFLGAQWVAQEYLLSPEDVKQIYNVDLGKDFTAYTDALDTAATPSVANDDAKKAGRACVWEIYSKTEALCYVVCDGYADYLKEPEPPAVELSRFWPIFTLTFNEVEHDDALFPPSDVRLARPMQKEYNRSRQGLSEHRRAGRPKTAVAKGKLDEEDKEKLMSHPANAVIEMNAMAQGEKIGDVLQPIVGPAIDPALYDTAHLFDDFQRVLGSSEANLGGTGGATATENSIAESSRTAGIASNIDDLDDLLNELARAGGQVLLKELTAESATKIAGPGAVWPEATREEFLHELALEVEAGSSGRPNKSAEIANFERLAPILMQIPGITPDWFAKQAILRLDDRLDLADALTSGAQSIVAMNANKQVSTGDPNSDPNQQGPQGSSAAAGGPAGAPPQGPSPMLQDAGTPQQFQPA